MDLEVQGRLKRKATRRIATPTEIERYDAVPFFDWTLLFSAKESVFKSLNPLVRRSIGFQEMELELDISSKRFKFQYLGSSIDGLQVERGIGLWSEISDHLITLFIVD